MRKIFSRPCLTERLLMECKESNQTNKQKYLSHKRITISNTYANLSGDMLTFLVELQIIVSVGVFICFHNLCEQAGKAQMILRICVGCSEPSLVA